MVQSDRKTKWFGAECAFPSVRMLPCVLLRHIGGVSIQGEANAKQHPVLVETVDNTPGVDNRGECRPQGCAGLARHTPGRAQ